MSDLMPGDCTATGLVLMGVFGFRRFLELCTGLSLGTAGDIEVPAAETGAGAILVVVGSAVVAELVVVVVLDTT